MSVKPLAGILPMTAFNAIMKFNGIDAGASILIVEHGISKSYSDLWAAFTPAEHFVQMYQDEAAFLETLEGFIAGGLLSGDSVIVIGTPLHIHSLDERLVHHGIDVDEERRNGGYIVPDAQETLDKFIVDGLPDEDKFHQTINEVLKQARRNSRRVRAFGEMVALLWADGYDEATIQLERLWHCLVREEEFTLFCAYPKTGFVEPSDHTIQTICETHSRVIN